MIEYKTERQRKEFHSELDVTTCGGHFRINPRVVYLLFWIEKLISAKYTKYVSLKITDVLRTQEEQDKIYKHNGHYQLNPWQSVHQYGRGIDISLEDLKEHNVDLHWLKNIVNKDWVYDFNKPDKDCLIIHDVGHGMHIHLQVHPNTLFKSDDKKKMLN